MVLALAGLFFVPTDFFLSMALGGILVVVVAVMASLTLLPAILGILGDRANALSISAPFRCFRPVGGSSGSAFWPRVAAVVMRYPVLSLVLSIGVLAAAAVPFLDMQTGLAGVTTLPDGARSKDGFYAVEGQFDLSLLAPVEIVVEGEIDSEPVQESISGSGNR